MPVRLDAASTVDFHEPAKTLKKKLVAYNRLELGEKNRSA